MKSSKHSERSSTYTRTAGIRQACDDVEAFQVVSSKLPHFFKQAPNPRCRHGLGEQGSERRVREKTFLPAKITRNLSICPRYQTTAPPDKNKPKKKKSYTNTPFLPSLNLVSGSCVGFLHFTGFLFGNTEW